MAKTPYWILIAVVISDIVWFGPLVTVKLAGPVWLTQGWVQELSKWIRKEQPVEAEGILFVVIKQYKCSILNPKLSRIRFLTAPVFCPSSDHVRGKVSGWSFTYPKTWSWKKFPTRNRTTFALWHRSHLDIRVASYLAEFFHTGIVLLTSFLVRSPYANDNQC
jgi:hypothetical protein